MGRSVRKRTVIRMSVMAVVLAAVVMTVGSQEALAADGTEPAEPGAGSGALPNPPSTQLYRMRDPELAEYIQWLNVAFASPADRVAHVAQQCLWEPYRLNASMFNYHESDCLTFVERTLAIALADSWDSYHKIIVRLRHGDISKAFENNVFTIAQGRLRGPEQAAEDLEFTYRNHFTIGEWIPNNRWCFEDITTQLGPGTIKPWIPLHHIMRKTPRLAKENITVNFPDVKVVDAFVPIEAVEDYLPQLKSGDVVLLIHGLWENTVAEHMGIVVVEEGESPSEREVFFIHSARPKVRKVALLHFQYHHAGYLQGYKILRLKADAQQQAAQEIAALADTIVVPPPSVD